MRKDRMKEIKVKESRGVQSYHGRNFHSESYAMEGFTKNYYYTSDRKIELTADYQRIDGKAMKGYGFEIETESFEGMGTDVLAEVYERVIFPMFPNGLFKMQTDASLGGGIATGSAECITQVMTKEAVRNSYPAFKAMFDKYFKAFHISASKTGNCGMHINISNACFGNTEKAQELAIRKLHYIVNKHFNAICALVRRNPNRTDYCRQMEYRDIRTCAIESIPVGHRICFNWDHYKSGRIELRIVGGQKNFAAFRNTVESVFHLVDRVKDISWKDCDSLVKVFEGCNNYVYDRLRLVNEEGYLSNADLNAIESTVKTVEYL